MMSVHQHHRAAASRRGVPRHLRRVAATGLTLAAIFALPGCATRQLAPDFAAISDAYAENMNRQMLLNLARLDQGHPAYFMAIGEVRIAHTQSRSLQGSANSANTQENTVAAVVTDKVAHVLGGNLTGSTQISASPTFVFIPINSEEAAKQLLAPVPVEVFATLFEQGWPVDQLMRVLVERIEVRFADPERTPILLVNSPTRGTPELFSRFLRTCEVIRELQTRGGLRLGNDDRFSPLGTAQVEAARLSAKDLNDSADKGRIWERGTDGGYALGLRRARLRFIADPRVIDAALDTFRGRESVFATATGQAEIDNIEAVLTSRPEIQSERPVDAEAAAHQTPERPRSESTDGVETILILRSFRNLLEAVAQEQRAFDELARDPAFFRGLPARQQHPVLRTDWSGREDRLTPPVTRVRYGDHDYVIADDADQSAATLESRWNRDVFRLLLSLSSQVSVDITKFQRQVIELSP